MAKSKQPRQPREVKPKVNPGVPPTPEGQGTSEWPDEGLTLKLPKVEEKKTKKQKQEKFDRAYGQKFTEIMFDDIQMMLYRTYPKGMDSENAPPHEKGPLGLMEAAELLGWSEESEELGVKFGKHYKFKDLEGHKIRLLNNPTNRPFRRNLALDYAIEILRGEWRLNGEPIIIDRYGRIQSGQHRLAGVIFANQMLKADLEKWSGYGWKNGVYIETVVVCGISEKAEVVDTIDIGQKRSLGDVMFRNDEFVGTEKVMAKMSNVLSVATRLVWLRSGGRKVSDAPKFPHSEALSFLKEHPRLKEAVTKISELDGTGKEGRRITECVSLGYAAGLMYLMAVSGTDRELYDDGSEDLDFTMWDKAYQFWTHFAKDTKDFPLGHPIKALRKRLLEITAGEGAARDEVVFTIVKAFNLWNEGKNKVMSIKLERIEHEDAAPEIVEFPRLGGLDVEI
jgi:hypothetical protein